MNQIKFAGSAGWPSQHASCAHPGAGPIL